MNLPTNPEEALLETDDASQRVLDAATKLTADPPAPEITQGTMQVTVWDEPPGAAGRRVPDMPGDTEETIAEQLVSAGIEEAERERRRLQSDLPLE